MTGETDGVVFARCQRPRTATPVRIALVGDPHLAPESRGTWKNFHRTERWLETTVTAIDRADVDAAAFAGDLTKDGTPSAYERFDDLVSALSVPWYAVPGNHDVPKTRTDTPGLTSAAFASRYAEGSFPWVLDCGPVSLVGLDSATSPDGGLRGTWSGAVSASQLRRLDDVLAPLDTPIVLVHHNRSALHPDAGAEPWSNFRLRDHETFATICARHEVPLIVSAHHHVPALVDGRPPELILPAVCSYPNAFALLEIGRSGTTVRLVPVATASERRVAHRVARTGPPLSQGIVSLVEARFSGFASDACVRQ